MFEVDPNVTSFCGRLKVLFGNSCFRYLLAACFFRNWSGFAIGLLSGAFFEERYGDYTEQFSVANAMVIIGAGIPASIIGGWMSDKLESKCGSIKGLIAGFGALLAIPFIAVTFLV